MASIPVFDDAFSWITTHLLTLDGWKAVLAELQIQSIQLRENINPIQSNPFRAKQFNPRMDPIHLQLCTVELTTPQLSV